MKNVIFLGWMLSIFGFAASANAEFSMNKVADEKRVDGTFYNPSVNRK